MSAVAAINGCKHHPTCKCIRWGSLPLPSVDRYCEHNLAGGPIPACHVDLRDFDKEKMTFVQPQTMAV